MRAIRDFKRYFNYAAFSAVSELKTQVADSYLGWLWWILDPLLFMFVYAFITTYIFGSNVDNIWLFVFAGLTVWNFFSTTVASSVGVIRSYAAVIIKAYIPKIMLVFMVEMVNFVKMLISLGICLISVAVLGLDVWPYILNIIPVLVTLVIFTYGVALISAFIGVYIADFSNVMSVILRFLFYMSGVFYTLDRFSEGLLSIYNMVCPTGFLIVQFRNALMLSLNADYMRMGYWICIGIVFIIIGANLLYRKENEYMKVI